MAPAIDQRHRYRSERLLCNRQAFRVGFERKLRIACRRRTTAYFRHERDIGNFYQ